METGYNLRSKTNNQEPEPIVNEFDGICYSHKNMKGSILYLHKIDVTIGNRRQYNRTNYYFAPKVNI